MSVFIEAGITNESRNLGDIVFLVEMSDKSNKPCVGDSIGFYDNGRGRVIDPPEGLMECLRIRKGKIRIREKADNGDTYRWNMKTKICDKCNIEQPLSEFYKNKTRKDGHTTWCKECQREWRRKYRAEHKEEIRERNRKYNQEHKEEKQRSDKEWRDNNPEKCRLQNKRHYAKRRRNLGYEELFDNPFQGDVHWHHINDKYVVALPKSVHELFFCGPDGEKHRNMLEPIVYEIYYND